jgi:hypothetical protein
MTKSGRVLDCGSGSARTCYSASLHRFNRYISRLFTFKSYWGCLDGRFLNVKETQPMNLKIASGTQLIYVTKTSIFC